MKKLEFNRYNIIHIILKFNLELNYVDFCHTFFGGDFKIIYDDKMYSYSTIILKNSYMFINNTMVKLMVPILNEINDKYKGDKFI